MRAIIAFGLAVVIAGCSSVAPSASDNDLLRRVAATTLPSGWRVDCNYDQYTDTRRCFAGAFGKSEAGLTAGAFQVVFFNGQGPNISVPNNFPGREALVRVDDNAPLPASSAEPLVQQLRAGRTAYVTYHIWPDGPRRMTVDITGFAEAYDLLRQRLAESSGAGPA